LALRLRRAGTPGTLDQLRLLVFADLTAGRNPLDRLARPGRQDTGQTGTEPTGASGSLDYDDDDYGDDADSAVSAPRPAAPVPALINLVVPAGTLFGWD